MPRLVQTSRAEQDLVEIWCEIAKRDERAADRVLELIKRRCEVWLQFRYGGEAYPAFGHDMRWFPAGHYVIFYRPDNDGIQVVRVVDGRRNLETAFFEG
jgi:toxin ParE1/3/4